MGGALRVWCVLCAALATIGTCAASLTAECPSPRRLLLSNSSSSIADTIRGAEPCPDGWTVSYSAGMYSGPRHCGVAWPSSANLTLRAVGGSVEITCGGQPVLWSYDYGDVATRLFVIDADPDSEWLFTQAASFLRITATQSTGLVVRVSQARFQCLLYPGPAAIVVRSPSGLARVGAELHVANCSFELGSGFGVALMGSATLSSLATSYAALSRGALFCVSDAALPPRASASLDASAGNVSISCLNCALSLAGSPSPCAMPSSPPPPLSAAYYQVCHVAPPPPPPTARPPPPPSTEPPPQSRLLFLLLLSSALIGAGLVALLVAAVWRSRAARAASASLSTDPHAPSPQDFL